MESATRALSEWHTGKNFVPVMTDAATEPTVRLQRQLLDLSPDAMMVRDAQERITFWNRGAERLYGWSAAEACGQILPDLICRNRGEHDRAYARALASGEWSGELHEADRNGRDLIVSSRWQVLTSLTGGVASILTVSTDLTAQKTLEAQSLRAQRLESIGTLAGGVAHDLNNILTPIIMSAPMLRENLPRDVIEMIVSTIETSAERGAEMVKQVLTFARGVEGERVLLLVCHLIKEMLKKCRESFPESIEISSCTARDLWPVLGDATQLQQVLLNLCANARDAMPEGGKLSLTAVNTELDDNYVSMAPGAKPGAYVVLCVEDTGVGIAREMIDRIFDPFFTTKELGKGTGLGLSTVLGIVRSHGGFVKVESQIGRGSIFRVFLPASRPPASGDFFAHERGVPAGHGELILVVDDELSIREVTASVLEKHGYRVETAGDGTEALARFAQAHGAVRVVMTDLMMPFMDGFTLIRTLKRMDPKVLVIASTGRGDEPRMLELQKLEVGTALRKPYTTDMLLTALAELIEGSRVR